MGKTNKLESMSRFKLVVIDESHNLRNRDSQRHEHVSDYIRKNESRVVLLSATPYNKSFTDIGNQLRLFLEADADIGIRPEAYIRFLGHAGHLSRACVALAKMKRAMRPLHKFRCHAKTNEITSWKNPCNRSHHRFCKNAHRYGRNGANHRRKQTLPRPSQGGF